MYAAIDKLRGGLIVSCQAHEREPLHGPVMMAAMAYSAELGGAVGIRANGREDIELIRKTVSIPIIGILKVIDYERRWVWITPTIETCKTVIEAGSDIVAVHATINRPYGDRLEDIVRACHDKFGAPVMADCGTLEDAIYADKAGCDILATTLAHGPGKAGPDLNLVKRFCEATSKPVIAEGGYWYPEQVAGAFEAGVHAVVVGTAITRPREITRHFAEVTPAFKAAPKPLAAAH